MNKRSVIAGVVTYNPEYIRLLQNLTELSKQVDDILIVDNGSTNIKELMNQFSLEITEHLTVIYNEENQGIAQALNQIMLFAKNTHYDWVLTLDQDSIIQPDLIDKYYKAALRKENFDVGMFTCLIKDRNFADNKYEYQHSEEINVSYCITSAAFTNVKKYFATTGYDVDFFIDCVDFDICYLLREKGFRICRINYLGLYHEVGHGENRYFFRKKIVVYHQASFRIYYLTRNTIWMHKKHRKTFSLKTMLRKLLTLWLRIVLYENDRAEKFKQFRLGIKDAKKYRGV